MCIASDLICTIYVGFGEQVQRNIITEFVNLVGKRKFGKVSLDVS